MNAAEISTMTPATMPAEIAKAISEVMSQIKTLRKAERNDHGGYSFASVDSFLAAIGPLCAASGLMILQDEEGLEILERGGKGWVKVTYAFTIAHASGAIWWRPVHRTVLMQIAGPQTTGATQSYALKMFLRSLLQIPTGDKEDADFAAPTPMEMREPAPKVTEQRQRPAPRPDPKRTEPVAEEVEPVANPEHTPIPINKHGSAMYGRWAGWAVETLQGKSEAWRMDWLEIHMMEMAELKGIHPDYAARIEEVANGSVAA